MKLRFGTKRRNIIRILRTLNCSTLLVDDVQTGCGLHPTSFPMGTVGSFPGGKVVGA
jgi:hypothetical protein